MTKKKTVNDLMPEICSLLKRDNTILQELLDYTKCRNLVMLNEYKSMQKEGNVPNKDIVQLLMKRYDISKATVHHVVYKTTLNKARYCKKCKTQMTKYIFGKNAGMCNNCLNL